MGLTAIEYDIRPVDLDEMIVDSLVSYHGDCVLICEFYSKRCILFLEDLWVCWAKVYSYCSYYRDLKYFTKLCHSFTVVSHGLIVEQVLAHFLLHITFKEDSILTCQDSCFHLLNLFY